ncbi:Nicotinate-nucleotide pyrophosphorylase [carboxylating] [Baekduia alba]|uniref:carboxylating nicotinate-nucleotide diphosphorylase n=1 Tax=Baekduia alba TaxID=2997333 RepID=UPI002341258F|nr:carboxylating nicotinate-nucleotide diphosphorylase [Baekduia alba]WCB92783.1 Nicotinate-nucleotide pyrophosphorylase [carboxylating] [Baekduia alba]
MPLDPTFVADVVARALAEDVGDGDVTTAATVPDGARATATITQKAPGVVFGLDLAEQAFRQQDPDAEIERLAPESTWHEPGTQILRITGTAAGIVTAERTALNFLQRLSGVATLTNRYVQAIDGTGARILDTRKTTPTLRPLEKAAVVAGGGTSHRFGLFDMVLIKENHVEAAGGIANAVGAAQRRFPDIAIEVEAETADDVREALAAGAPRILLDNMTPDAMRAIATEVAGRAELEASGNIDLHTVRAAAETGVDFISVGALTHSAPALDLSLILERLP